MAASISAKHRYREAMEQVHSYNSKLLLDRRLRMPYIDNQTGLAQQDCHLWVSRVQRCAPMRKGQIYSYPSRRWMVRKRPDFVGLSKEKKEKKIASEASAAAATTAATEDNNNNTQETVNENESKTDVVKTEETSMSTIVEAPVPMSTAYVDEFYDDDPFDSDLDSDEEFGSRKKKRKSTRNSRSSKRNSNYNNSNANGMAFKFGAGDHKWKVGKVVGEDLSKTTVEEKKKFYDCQFCSKRYKNQQSLRYHYEHYNHNLASTESTTATTTSSTVTAVSNPVTTATSTMTSSSSEQSTSPQPANDQPLPNHVTGAKRKKGMPPSSFCDFCLGTANSTKKNTPSGELISCADCGRSGHPSCLQFNENLTDQVKKYKWQCIECKSCSICGTSDNDEQLLFCDDCDRGYHMYCLTPPIAEPPEGSWQCQLCEARVKGKDISSVAVLTQHMDISFQLAVKSSAATSTTSSLTETVTTAETTAETNVTSSTEEPSKVAVSIKEEPEDFPTPMEVDISKIKEEPSSSTAAETSAVVTATATFTMPEVATTTA